MKSCSALGLVVLSCCFAGLANSADTEKDRAAIKKALGELQEFIGPWKGNGETKEGKSQIWKETMNWGWKFKGDDSWMGVEFTDSKSFDKGELKYLPEKKLYQLTLTDKDKKDLVFEGELKKKILTLTRVDPESKDKQTITMSTNNDGARLIYEYKVQTKGKGIDKRLFMVQHSKEGASIGSAKKNECIVTGGLGTMQVSFGGKTYYVCCSGCRDAFNEEPKKFIDEFEKKKKK
jgi:hypothetical protein